MISQACACTGNARLTLLTANHRSTAYATRAYG
jgi:hypothetical protein